MSVYLLNAKEQRCNRGGRKPFIGDAILNYCEVQQTGKDSSVYGYRYPGQKH